MCVSPFLPPYYARPGRKSGTLLSPAFGDEVYVHTQKQSGAGPPCRASASAHDPGRRVAPSMRHQPGKIRARVPQSGPICGAGVRHQPRVTMVLVQIT